MRASKLIAARDVPVITWHGLGCEHGTGSLPHVVPPVPVGD